MKKLSKIVLVVFSVFILIIGICINLLAIGWLEYGTVFSLVENALTTEPQSRILLVTTELCILFAVICIFSDTSSNKDEPKSGRDVLMQNDNGKLMISRDTIENLVNSVVGNYPSVMESNTKIYLDSENNVRVLEDLIDTKEVIIKELTLNMQNKIKEAIKKTSDLEVKEVDVRIKNITNPIDKNMD